MRITFVIPSLSYGGTEKIVTAMANYWAERGKRITIITFELEGTVAFYKLSQAVERIQLGIFAASDSIIAGISNNFRRVSKLRKAIKATRPDIVISFLIRTNVRVLLATLGLNVPAIVSDRSDPFLDQPGKIWSLLAKLLYPLAAGIVVFTRYAASYFPPRLKQKIRIFPNPVLISRQPLTPQNDNYNLVAVGRLEYEKGFDLLLQAFALAQKNFPNLTMTIWGEGSQRQNLEALVQQLGVTGKVSLPGTTRDIAKALSTAHLFVQTSRNEGFGNALCEAMAVGVPVIATDCSGPREIIHHGIDGLLVPVGDVDALVKAISELLTDASKRQSLSARGVEIVKRFNLDEIMGYWEKLLVEVTQMKVTG